MTILSPLSTLHFFKPTTYNLQPTTYNLQPTTYNIQPQLPTSGSGQAQPLQHTSLDYPLSTFHSPLFFNRQTHN
ncbi:hypothetical protein FHG64_18595 [Antarcticibacterium flavum]|uniref:Uncharacterized protein n=1 Tax=Antarcticibacterium flavum TaxID=2058175 RepID=A0A5B7X761_9FLAO|nr:hypothetical protein FHG64_18595 [Antarcticibacterium flavum]